MKAHVAAFTLIIAACLGACVLPGPWVATPAADPRASSASGSMPRMLGIDPATRKTNQLLAAVGADKLAGLRPMDHARMDHGQMDHAQMGHAPDHPAGHSQAPDPHERHRSPPPAEHAAHSAPSATPAPTAPPQAPAEAALTEEMKKLSDEMKKTAEELKKKTVDPKKPAEPAQHDHSAHDHGTGSPKAKAR